MAKVLIAVDGSELAIEAGRRAIGLLGAEHEFVVLEVAQAPFSSAGLGAMTLDADVTPPEVWQRLSDDAMTEARADLAEAVQHLRIPARERVETGPSGETVCQVAADEKADLVIVCSHGKGWARRALLGSVSHHVVQHAPCPVLVVRAPES
ncbi:MAG: universal stress protein [Acidimicrobiaceae bacterium]|nr:universal stress protein [Acidimicrobiaceae bacterium]